ncbi:MAG: aldo/keto reductase, partial [Ilumatobacteraceae bacterium]
GALKGYDWLAESLRNPEALERVERLRPIAEKLDCTMAQLALAWCAKNPNVSTVITGASRPAQVAENFEALDVIDRLDEDVMSRIEAAVSAAANRNP